MGRGPMGKEKEKTQEECTHTIQLLKKKEKKKKRKKKSQKKKKKKKKKRGKSHIQK